MQDDFHMAHLNRYGPSLNDNIKKVAFLIFFRLPTPSEVSLSRIVSPKKAVFRAFFLENHFFDPFRPNEDHPVLYMTGKLWISSFWWYKEKNICLHPAERAIFYDGPHRYFLLYWEAVLCNLYRNILDFMKHKLQPNVSWSSQEVLIKLRDNVKLRHSLGFNWIYQI